MLNLLRAVAALWLSAASALAADLAVVGTGDGLEVLRAVGAAFTADNPDTGILVPPSIHSSGGINAVRRGAARTRTRPWLMNRGHCDGFSGSRTEVGRAAGEAIRLRVVSSRNQCHGTGLRRNTYEKRPAQFPIASPYRTCDGPAHGSNPISPARNEGSSLHTRPPPFPVGCAGS
jgi:hypothetical protein